ncbi:hypothetical protein MGG_15890 [Pyricularia oryzae 70-15]|uniref:Uncharacterized protein n=2 Tax=Pyricularia oryzae TaxID=318829 RepID=G4MUI7_PYRO7|nr:uncharacterized protein MGG_15890 [Pyricularia oryzae 70-15]EHA55679.1 hypothetical protein MGG_15890 [Pyricularia oryzae 70-15]KAI7927520.1 hypothetical protein M9X92_002243 [Pyricularia oryzae]KAI7932273.1 hypothetical protein M0657_000712 [Pyricularia oryzae]QBZ57390.1 hypothetical protein PoMZ_02314 [Pyricularia oryzae]
MQADTSWSDLLLALLKVTTVTAFFGTSRSRDFGLASPNCRSPNKVFSQLCAYQQPSTG